MRIFSTWYNSSLLLFLLFMNKIIILAVTILSFFMINTTYATTTIWLTSPSQFWDTWTMTGTVWEYIDYSADNLYFLTTMEWPFSIDTDWTTNSYGIYDISVSPTFSLTPWLSIDTSYTRVYGTPTTEWEYIFYFRDFNGFDTHYVRMIIVTWQVQNTSILSSSGGVISINNLDNVDTSVNNLLKSVFEVLKLLPFVALILGGFYLLDKLFGILPRPGGKK